MPRQHFLRVVDYARSRFTTHKVGDGPFDLTQIFAHRVANSRRFLGVKDRLQISALKEIMHNKVSD
jgi:hypothetical protein